MKNKNQYKIVGKIICHSLKWINVAVGIGIKPFTFPYVTNGKFISILWLTHTWRYFSSNNYQVKGKYRDLSLS